MCESLELFIMFKVIIGYYLLLFGFFCMVFLSDLSLDYQFTISGNMYVQDSRFDRMDILMIRK